MIRLVQREFRIWLRQRQGVMVGDPTNQTHCPLCQFLKEKGAKRVRMAVCARTVDGLCHDNALWQGEFQRRAMQLQRELKVTGLRGREALEALNDIASR